VYPLYCFTLVTAIAMAIAQEASGDTSQDPRPNVTNNEHRSDVYGDPLPAGAIARLGTIRFRHDTIYGSTTAFSPNGKWLAASSFRSLRLWEMTTGRLLWEISKDDYYGTRIVFTPDSKHLARLQKDALSFVDAVSGEEQRRLPIKAERLAFSPDGQRLATVGTKDAPVEVWETATGKPLVRAARQEGLVISLQFVHQGRTLLLFDLDKNGQPRFSRWNAETGEQLSIISMALPRSLGAARWRKIALSPDGRLLAVVPYSSEPVRLWDATTGKLRGTLQGEGTAGKYGLAFSPDSKILATDWPEGRDDKATISLWDTEIRQLIRRFSISRQDAFLQFAPDGHTLLSDSTLGMACLWDIRTGRQMLRRPAHEASVNALAFTPDGRKVLSGSQDGSVRVWEAAMGQPISELPGYLRYVAALVVLPGGQAVLSGGYDAELHVHDLQTGKMRRLILLPEEKKSPDVSYPCLGLVAWERIAASYILMPGPGPLVCLWDVDTGRVLSQRTDLSKAHFIAFAPDARIMATYGATYAPVNAAHAQAMKKGPPLQVVHSQVVLQQVTTGRELFSFPLPDRNGYQAAFSADGRTLITYSYKAGSDAQGSYWKAHTLHLWELATGKERLTIPSPDDGNETAYQHIVFARDGRTLATIRRDFLMQLWDVATGRELLRLPGHRSDVRSVALSPNGSLLATGHVDTSILVWDVSARRPATQKPLTAFELEQQWTYLGSSDARKAHEAIWGLAASPVEATEFLRQHLEPVRSIPAERLSQLLADLDSSQFTRREAASHELAELGEQAEATLTEALRALPSAESRNRIEALLARPRNVRKAEELRSLRALEVLDQIGTSEAGQVLRKLAEGAPDARLTREAKASLARREAKR
jgi:WD40 repeat protein